ncbi:MAG: methyltransferase domain-containing protein [Candidatus Eisenbacteria bacterium]|uniref:Methyltransferase domain-containing protein n=1 Tax=Eiseniibacteriota bacterium TaxID=2212470 RepID=A0A849SRI6_UNCEI|nr:methyltransferase domain-containing protein [Candidatus Eisenbacteria bacterium]
MNATELRDEPPLEIDRGGELPFLVEHWYLGSEVRHYMMVRRFREVLRAAALAPGLRVLDLGCGWAYGTHWARVLGCEVRGVDLGLDQLKWARRALPIAERLRLVQGNAKALPFRAASVDRVISVEMMEHVYRPDRPAVFAEIARVLAPGGRVALSTPNPVSPIEFAKQLAVRVPALRRALPSSCFPEAADDAGTYHPYRYHHPLDETALRAGLEGAGLRVRGARRFLWVPKTLPAGAFALGRALEAFAEALPLLSRMGATTLVWAEKGP